MAGVVVDQRGRVLVIQRADSGQWQPPGGVLEAHETFEQGVVREVLEETGVAVAVHDLTGVYKNLREGVVSLVFRCSPLAGDPCRTSEAADARWMAPSDALALMSEVFAVRVRDALSESATAVRVHDGRVLL